MAGTDKAVIVDGIRKTFGDVVALRESASKSGAARCSACWDPTVLERPRRWTSCPRWPPRTRTRGGRGP